MTLYIIFNLLYNVATILMLKQGGSNVLYLASTVLVPFSNVMFALPTCMPQHQPVHTTGRLGANAGHHARVDLISSRATDRFSVIREVVVLCRQDDRGSIRTSKGRADTYIERWRSPRACLGEPDGCCPDFQSGPARDAAAHLRATGAAS